ncbi:Protein CBG26369 [Caenorhabditis briggsae]|uniref:Protein CBG26369 n=1 Tax=Caenorhabditis briggsae TaxID=6238 RepID=B6IG35_CAEBR|nr:Protein CBG26369 [Caenorhabditis briggsae]CAR98865.1 Protein CBG26369 [Caenorhabditis briggsae]
MFGLLARGVSAFVASVSGLQKDDSGIEGSSQDDSRSAKSTNSSIRRKSDSIKSAGIYVKVIFESNPTQRIYIFMI